MTGPTFPPGLRRGPDCQIRIRNGRPSFVTPVNRNPYARPLAATPSAVLLVMASGVPIFVKVLAVILGLICVVLFLVEALR
jgi:hypothetical protein